MYTLNMSERIGCDISVIASVQEMEQNEYYYGVTIYI